MTNALLTPGHPQVIHPTGTAYNNSNMQAQAHPDGFCQARRLSFCLLLAALTLTQITRVYGQGPLNANTRNIQAQFYQVNFVTDDNDCGIAWYDADRPYSFPVCNSDGVDDMRFKFFFNGTPISTGGSSGNPAPTVNGTWNMLSAENQGQVSDVYRFDSWEHDSDPLDEWNGNDDFPCGNASQTITYSDYLPGIAHSVTKTCINNGNNGKFRFMYRYAKGNTLSDALDFGSLDPPSNYSPITKTHQNRIKAQSGMASQQAWLSYSNNPQNLLGDDPEIFYKFQLPGSASCTQISVNVDGGVGGVSVYLAKLTGTGTGTGISEILGQAQAGNVLSFSTRVPSGNYAVVLEGQGTELVTLTINAVYSSALDAGSVQYNLEYDTSHLGFNPPAITNLLSPTGPGASKNWQKKEENNPWVSFDPPVTSNGYNPPVINIAGTTKFRRIIEYPTCSLIDYSNEITIFTYPNNGTVQGMITSPPLGTGGVSIPGVTVQLRSITPLQGEPNPINATVVSTSSNGPYNYSFSGFYAGGANDVQFTVVPILPGHVFEADTIEITLNSNPNNSSATAVHFDDVSAFEYSGTVHHLYNGETCGMPGVEIWLKEVGGTNQPNLVKDTTDQNGNYQIVIPGTGTWVITPKLQGHTFIPATDSLFINSNLYNKTFRDTKERTLTLSLKAGCNQEIGTGYFRIYDTLACYNLLDQESTTGGFFQKVLPARKYTIVVTGFEPNAGVDPDIFNASALTTYFGGQLIQADLTAHDTTIQLIFHPTPTLQISGLPEPPCPDILYGVLPIHTDIPVALEAYDYPPNTVPTFPAGCFLDTATFIVHDYISTYTGNPLVDTFSVLNGTMQYVLHGGVPNITPPFTKHIEFNLLSSGGLSDTSATLIVEGNRPRSPSFTSVSPQIPQYILRDPPGDNSYAKIEEGEQFESKTTIGKTLGEARKGFIRGVLDYEFVSNTKVFGQVGLSSEHEAMNIEDTVFTNRTTMLTEFSTSNEPEPENIGEPGDTYVGAAFNMLYAISDIVRVNTQRCEVTLERDLSISPDSFATTFVYTHHFIQNVLVPDLRNKIIANLNPDSTQYWLDQVRIWEERLKDNKRLKESADVQQNFSFNGGPTITKTYTSTNASTYSYEWTDNITSEEWLSLGGVLGGYGAEAGGNFTNKWTSWNEAVQDTTYSKTVKYILNDDDSEDYFSVDVLKDTRYPTFAFRTLASETSCPYEAGSLPRHLASLTPFPTVYYDVPANDTVEFILNLANISESEDTLHYYLLYDDNSGGTGIKTDWTSEFEIPMLLNYNEPNEIEVHFWKNPASNTYAYENLLFKVVAGCVNNNTIYIDPFRVLATAKLSVYFQTPCSSVTISEPEEGWLINQESGNLLDIHLSDYDLNNLNSLSIMYAPVTSSSYQQAISINPASLNPNSAIGSTVQWNVTNIPDGNYKIRARITCGSSIINTGPITGKIERSSPYPIGYPSPNDHILSSANPFIDVDFNEAISPLTSSANVELQNEITGLTYETTVIVADRTVIVIPTVDLLSLPPAAYKVTYSGVEDLYGNPTTSDVIWYFTVGQYNPVYCDQNTVYYVDGSLNPAYSVQDGLSWSSAFVNLHDALLTACPGSSIYVAQGTYYPNDTSEVNPLSGDSTWFEWTHSYHLYGGFPSGGAPFGQRNPGAYPTILSGDANHNSMQDPGDCHTILKIRAGVSARMEGFVIEGAYADGQSEMDRSGAVFNNGDVVMVNCIFRNNVAEGNGTGTGGAWYNNAGDVTIANAAFYDNSSSQQGGALTTQDGDISLINCVFSQNTALLGAALALGSQASIVNTIFFDNHMNPDNDFLLNGGNAVISYSAFGQLTLPVGMNYDSATTLFNTDPLFVDPLNNHFSLQPGSPCADFGYNASISGLSLTDIAGNQRITNALTPIAGLNAPQSRQTPQLAIVDLGAYEISPCDAYTGTNALHVDASATAGYTGLTWGEPINTLSGAFLVAATCGIDSVLVAGGTYLPEEAMGADPRMATFAVLDSMVVLGGFPAGGGIRDPRKYVSILNGNIGSLSDHADDAYHVVRMENVSAGTIFDGFTIMHGNANGDSLLSNMGGGLLVQSSGYGKVAAPILSNLTFKYNLAKYGAALATHASDLSENRTQLYNSVMADNHATVSGGAIYEYTDTTDNIGSLVAENVLIVRNTAAHSGGAVFSACSPGSQNVPAFTNCTIAHNIADSDNNATGNGGAVAVSTAGTGVVNARINNSIVWENRKGAVLNQFHQPGSTDTITVNYSNVSGGYPGTQNFNTDPGFAGWHVGNYQLDRWSPLIDQGNNLKVTQALDLNTNTRLTDQVDLGAFEYDGVTRRDQLPEEMEAVTLHCENPANILVPGDGVTYSLWTTNFSQLIDGKEIGDEPLKYLTTGNAITEDSTFAVIVSRDSSFAFTFDNTTEELTIQHHAALEVSANDVLRISCRVKPTSVSGVQRLWYKHPNISFGLSGDGVIFSAYGNPDLVSPSLGITPGNWTELVYEYLPQSGTSALLIIRKDGQIVWSTVAPLIQMTGTENALIGSAAGGADPFTGQIDYLALHLNNRTVVQLDFVSATGSPIAYDLSMDEQNHADLNPDIPATPWVPGHDLYVRLSVDTLGLTVTLDPGTSEKLVLSPDDAGYGTLRYQIANACPSDTIRFATVLMGDTIKLQDQIFVGRDVFIEGLGFDATGTVLDGQGFSRLFDLPAERTITFKDMQLINGYHPEGGGAFEAPEQCTLWNVLFKDHNTAGQREAINTTGTSTVRFKGTVRFEE